MSPRPAALLALLLAAPAIDAQERGAREAGPVAFGPRLLHYPVQCTDPAGCRIECFQQGNRILDRGGISARDEVRMVATEGVPEAIVPQWIEIRPAGERGVQTLLLSRHVFCDLKGLVIAPKHRP